MESKATRDIREFLKSMSDEIDPGCTDLAIILAAGQGKRIKSSTSKMLHTIWGKPTVSRVCNAAENGLGSPFQVVVLGVKAIEVAQALGRKPGRVFVYQEKQLGTGHAVQTALDALPQGPCNYNIFVFPGDMGLLSSETARALKDDFNRNHCHMMLLTGTYSGNPDENYYGRILRRPGNRRQAGPIIAIKEHKEIMALGRNDTVAIAYQGKEYRFKKEELLAVNEFNTGAYVFKGQELRENIGKLKASPATGEIYLTDLVEIFNAGDLKVRGSRVSDSRLVMGFNVKSVLNYMESVAREQVYNRLKDIITIRDENDFFIADEVADQIVELDSRKGPLDIVIGQGVYIGPEVTLDRRVVIDNRAMLTGRIILKEGVYIGPGAVLTNYPGQTIVLEKGVKIFEGNVIKGNLTIGEGSRLERYVRVTGSDSHPTRIGRNAVIKGTTYLFGVKVDDDVTIEHSIIKEKRVRKVIKYDGSIQPVRYVLPYPEGLDSIEPL